MVTAGVLYFTKMISKHVKLHESWQCTKFAQADRLSQQENVMLHVLVAENQGGMQKCLGPKQYLSSGLLCAALALGSGPAAGCFASSACWSTELGRAATPVHNSKDRSNKLLNLLNSCSISF